MDLSAINGRLSDAEKARMMRTSQCFRCGTRGHLARNCPEKNGKGKSRKEVRIAKLEEEYGQLTGGTKEMVRNAEGSKNGAAQE
ncbi:hypothetical protein PSTG_19303 [Puccinia striiformis f. sp. tritici PST-78]|nr:hypothetical protein PSTG_19357 [Puccinia striiformis f. sp. tritici PST-78]KNE87266.1 hypothetical protein PSTG_19353 [Puccinia striiformis f. sp. tritici PST-78]KNE87315.1 hypothetical protein PSTG_19303 [Puccinia striiformis f. sp. tritici PST-78]